MVNHLERLPLPIDILNGPQCNIKWPVWLLPIVADLIAELKYPDLWEGEEIDRAYVGAVIDEQIARLIGAECQPLPPVDCETDNQQNDTKKLCGGLTDEILALAEIGEKAMLSGFLTCDDFRNNNGVLEINCCGTWKPLLDTGEKYTEVIPPDVDTNETSIYPCGKAAHLAGELVRFVDKAWDDSDNTLPLLFVWQMQNYMGYDLKNFWTDQVQSAMLIAKGIVVASYGTLAITKSEVLPDGIEEELTCRLLPVMTDTPVDDADLIYDTLKTAINTIFQPFSLPDGSFVNTIWDYARQAFGRQLCHDIAQAGAYTNSDCDCAGGTVVPPPVYSGVVWWSGQRTVTTATQGAQLLTAQRDAINEMRYTVFGGQNANFQEVIWQEEFDAIGSVGEIEIQLYNRAVSDVADYFPAKNWTDTNPTPTSDYTTPTFINAAAPTSVTYSQDTNKVTIVAKWDTPADLSASSLEIGAKLNPKDQSVNQQAYRVQCKIVYAGEQR